MARRHARFEAHDPPVSGALKRPCSLSVQQAGQAVTPGFNELWSVVNKPPTMTLPPVCTVQSRSTDHHTWFGAQIVAAERNLDFRRCAARIALAAPVCASLDAPCPAVPGMCSPWHASNDPTRSSPLGEEPSQLHDAHLSFEGQYIK